ncbi:MAG: HEPN domain-containing protein [Thermodesulfobacteriota bacterium]|nr:HEPN domain-containing protein [Thermodesulfobacteriota bacterium]
MKNETRTWLSYADENLKAAKILLKHDLYNPCLQNVQQSIEKSLKAILLEKVHSQRKTHSITELIRILHEHQINLILTEDECDLLDAIYLPSKYPLTGVLPDFEPDVSLCRQCVILAEWVGEQVRKAFET